jgi:hypothetical protein
VAFDIDQRCIAELRTGHDRTGEVRTADLRAKLLQFTSNAEDLRG